MKKSSKFIKGFKIFLIIVFVVKIAKLLLFLTKFKKKSDIFLFFNGKKQVFKDKKLKNTTISILFGGMELDLREAIIGDDPVVLDITGRFSGFSIKVNPECNVKLEGSFSKRGISNESKYDEDNKEAPQWTIKYDLKFPGLEIQ